MLPYSVCITNRNPGSNNDNTTTHTGMEAKAPCLKQPRTDFYSLITKTKKKPTSKRKHVNSTRKKETKLSVINRERNLTSKFSNEKEKARFKFTFNRYG